MLGAVRANLGECPLPPPERVLRAAAAALGSANRYPDPRLAREVEELAAGYIGVEPGLVRAVPGSDTALEAVVRAAGYRRAATVHPGFYTYSRIPAALGLAVEAVPLEPGVDGQLGGRRLAALLSRLGLVVVDDPNNPLGVRVVDEAGAREALRAAPRASLLLVDEAYHEFSGYTLAGLLSEGLSVAVLRTLSKAFALAGLRVGFIAAPPWLAERLASDPLPFRLPTPSLAAARAALEDPGYARECARLLLKGRDELAARLSRLGFRVHVGHAPFILVETGVPGAPALLEGLGVRVAGMEWWRPGAVRVSPGTPEDNSAILEAFERLAAAAPGPGAEGQVGGV